MISRSEHDTELSLDEKNNTQVQLLLEKFISHMEEVDNFLIEWAPKLEKLWEEHIRPASDIEVLNADPYWQKYQ